MNAGRTGGSLRGLVVAGILAGAVSLVPAGCKPKAAAPGGGGPEGSPATRFLRTHQLQGRVVLIEFGLVGCELSDKGLDEMIRMRRGNAVPQLAYVRVEGSRDQRAADQYYALKSSGFLVWRDPEGSLAGSFDATAYPTFVLVDKFGHVRYRGGFPDKTALPGWVQTLLAEKADPGPDAPRFAEVVPEVSGLLASTKLPDIEDQTKPLEAYMGGRGLLLAFVDTSCPFSGTAIGQMPDVARTLSALDVASVTVNIGEAKDDVLKFYAQRITGTPVVYDVTDATKDAWNMDSVPTVVLFDAKGTMLYRGRALWADLAVAAETGLGLATGTLKFGAAGTGFG